MPLWVPACYYVVGLPGIKSKDSIRRDKPKKMIERRRYFQREYSPQQNNGEAINLEIPTSLVLARPAGFFPLQPEIKWTLNH